MSLREYVSAETTSLGRCFDGWEQAVTSAGKLLERAGCIQHSYTEDMVRLVREMGPYIVVMPGVALAHARPRGNVARNSVSLVTVPEGVPFGSPSNDPVRALFAIAARTDREHLALFQAVARFIGEQENLALLERAERFDQIPF